MSGNVPDIVQGGPHRIRDGRTGPETARDAEREGQ